MMFDALTVDQCIRMAGKTVTDHDVENAAKIACLIGTPHPPSTAHHHPTISDMLPFFLLMLVVPWIHVLLWCNTVLSLKCPRITTLMCLTLHFCVTHMLAHSSGHTSLQRFPLRVVSTPRPWDAGSPEARSTLPMGLETHMGINGQNLNGGMRQRVCIARAIAANKPYVLMVG